MKSRHFLTWFFDVIFDFSPKILKLILPIFNIFRAGFIMFLRVLSSCNIIRSIFIEIFMLECSLATAKWNLYSINFLVPTGTILSLYFYMGAGLITSFPAMTWSEQNARNDVITSFFDVKKRYGLERCGESQNLGPLNLEEVQSIVKHQHNNVQTT